MANKLFAEVVIAGSYRNLAKSTRGAQKELSNFEKATKKMSGKVKAMLAGIALGGFAVVADAIVDMTKAAADDAKSIALLNKQMDNSWKANDRTKKSVDDYLNSMSNMSGVLDDDLRPAFGKIVKVTKDSQKAMKAFDMVMDISADTGKDVNTVAIAYSKYLAGNKTSLERMIPGLKEAANQTKFLKERMDGMTEVAGANNPFARITVVIENFKEKLGEAFVPIANDIADWLAGPEAQQAMNDFAKSVKDAFGYLTSPQGKKDIDAFIAKFMKLIEEVAMTAENVNKLLDGDFSRDSYINPVTGNKEAKGRTGIEKIMDFFSGKQTTSSSSPMTGGNVTITVNAPNVSGTAVLDALKKTAKSKGVPLRLLVD